MTDWVGPSWRLEGGDRQEERATRTVGCARCVPGAQCSIVEWPVTVAGTALWRVVQWWLGTYLTPYGPGGSRYRRLRYNRWVGSGTGGKRRTRYLCSALCCALLAVPCRLYSPGCRARSKARQQQQDADKMRQVKTKQDKDKSRPVTFLSKLTAEEPTPNSRSTQFISTQKGLPITNSS